MPISIARADVVILGAGAAGLMCAIAAGRRGRRVMVLDHADAAGRKIALSGGGHCNFSNIRIDADHYLSHNSHFCKSALSRFTQWDFIELLRQHRIDFAEREHGRLFCTGSAKDILGMLLAECRAVGVRFHFKAVIDTIERTVQDGFQVSTRSLTCLSQSLVVATGGLALPSIGATDFGFNLARKFQIHVWPVSAGLTPLLYTPDDRSRLAALSGISVEARVRTQRSSFHDHLLFTHQGLSGPATLQSSSYWQSHEPLNIDLLPSLPLMEALLQQQGQHPRRQVTTALAEYLPKRLVVVLGRAPWCHQTLQQLSRRQMETVARCYQNWGITPAAKAGYGSAEVTLGGVDCDAISSKTMQSLSVPGLFFCGEVLDITGWLGGYNLQWAWSSGWCAGQYA